MECDSDPEIVEVGSEHSSFSFGDRLDNQKLGEDLAEKTDHSVLRHGETQLGMHYRKIFVPRLVKQTPVKTLLKGFDEEDLRFLKQSTGAKVVSRHLSHTERPHENLGTPSLSPVSKSRTERDVAGEDSFKQESSHSGQGLSESMTNEIPGSSGPVNLRRMGPAQLVLKDVSTDSLLPPTNESAQNLDASQANLLADQRPPVEGNNRAVVADAVPVRTLGARIRTWCNGCWNACTRIFR